jgi:hypothetical protein
MFTITFRLSIALPVVCALWSVFTYHNALGTIDLALAQWPELLLLAGILVVPAATLYFAASLFQRAWFVITCCAVVILFAGVLCGLMLVRGGGMALPAIAVIEAAIAIVALLTALLLKLQRKLTQTL